MQRQLRIIALIASTNGRYDFTDANLNRLTGLTPTPFQEWLQAAWAGQSFPM